ncbi:Mbov_0389 family ICE element HExxH motif-containing protein [Metamycoplasma auris]|nr:hypothetical protein [Metamycoplasma auris]
MKMSSNSKIEIKKTDIEFVLKNTISNINEFFINELKLKDFLSFVGRIRPQLSLLNLRYLYYKENSINEKLDADNKVLFSEIKTFKQWRNLDTFVRQNENKLYLFCPIQNKETKDIIFSALPVYDLSSTNYIPKPLKKIDIKNFKKKCFSLWEGWDIYWTNNSSLHGNKLILETLNKSVFLNEKYAEQEEEYLLIHEFGHKVSNHTLEDRQDLLKEYVVIKACEMCLMSLDYLETNISIPKYKNYKVSTTINNLSDKEKYQLLEEILTLGYKLIEHLKIDEYEEEI